jgi:hypothetical protein
MSSLIDEKIHHKGHKITKGTKLFYLLLYLL